MRILVLFAHPGRDELRRRDARQSWSRRCSARGHEVDDCDLNAENFDPVMTPAGPARLSRRRASTAAASRPMSTACSRRRRCCFSFPVWNMGFPAILKGFVDKVFLPGVSFHLKDNGDYVPSLHNIKRLGVACTYGGARLRTFLAGDPCRRFVTRSLLANCAPGARCDYVAHYDMNHTTPERRAAFLRRVEARFSRW